MRYKLERNINGYSQENILVRIAEPKEDLVLEDNNIFRMYRTNRMIYQIIGGLDIRSCIENKEFNRIKFCLSTPDNYNILKSFYDTQDDDFKEYFCDFFLRYSTREYMNNEYTFDGLIIDSHRLVLYRFQEGHNI